MKKMLLVVVSTLCFNTAQANFSFHSDSENACQAIPGQWVGKGQATNWLIGDCIYHGTGVASALDADGNFQLEVFADKDSGSFICPAHSQKKLSGHCANGDVSFNTEYGVLMGVFTENTGTANGSLTVSPGIFVDVSLEFQKAG